jgi:hypothetical protein
LVPFFHWHTALGFFAQPPQVQLLLQTFWSHGSVHAPTDPAAHTPWPPQAPKEP